MFREFRALGASLSVAKQVAANSRRSWRNSAKLIGSNYVDHCTFR